MNNPANATDRAMQPAMSAEGRADGPRPLAAFQYQSQAVRVIRGEDGEPWFVAVDVCKVLNISNPTMMLKRIKNSEKKALKIIEGLVNQGFTDAPIGTNVNLVNEPGLYRLIFTSNKPEAEAFQDWVYHEVLPAIRKTGAYVAPAAGAPRKRRGRLPLAERTSVMDAGLPVPYYRFYAAYLDVYPLHKNVLKDHVAAARASLLVVGRQFRVDPGLYVSVFDEPGSSPAASTLPQALPTQKDKAMAPASASVGDRVLNATDLGIKLNLCHGTGRGNGKAVNDLLIREGFAKKGYDGVVVPTERGAPHARLSPVPGSLTRKQVKWHVSVLPFLRQALRAQQNEDLRARQGQLFQ